MAEGDVGGGRMACSERASYGRGYWVSAPMTTVRSHALAAGTFVGLNTYRHMFPKGNLGGEGEPEGRGPIRTAGGLQAQLAPERLLGALECKRVPLRPSEPLNSERTAAHERAHLQRSKQGSCRKLCLHQAVYGRLDVTRGRNPLPREGGLCPRRNGARGPNTTQPT